MRYCLFFILSLLLISCGFRLQGERPLASPLHRLYIETPDPYSHLTRYIQDYLKASNVTIVNSPREATMILAILRDEPSEELLSVNSTQQTRQYKLHVTVEFELRTPKGIPVFGPQTLSEERVITIQSNQILGSSNEANLYYEQMRRTLAYSLINRLSSREVTHIIIQTAPHYS